MSDITPNLALPFILPAQAQKHVTHNEALLGLDAVVQLVLASHSATPPIAPLKGECHFVSAGATGSWSGKSGRIAAWQDGAWNFLVPRSGWRAFDLPSASLQVFDGEDWITQPLPADGSFSSLGINADADATNRLAVSAAATLLNHVGDGHQLKINKATATDTASLLFQTDWQGRAELGLAASDQFTLKVSSDGATWSTALEVGADGIARTGNRPAVRAARSVVDHAPAAGVLTGFNGLHDLRGGFSLGAVLPSGFGSRLVVPADGLYLVGVSTCVLSSTGHAAKLLRNGTITLAAVDGLGSAGPLTQQALSLALLNEGDWLAIEHQGSATLRFGPGRTEMIAAMI